MQGDLRSSASPVPPRCGRADFGRRAPESAVGRAAALAEVRRQASAALLLRAVYQQAVSVEVGRVWFRDDTPFDVLRDKGVFLFTAGARF